MDADVAQIVNITSATPERAAQYLQLADGDLDAAVMLYFESNGADPSGGPSSGDPPPPSAAASRPSGLGGAQNPIDLDEDDTYGNDEERQAGLQAARRLGQPSKTEARGATFDADAEYARKLQEEMYGEAGGPGPSGEEEVRAPIARQTETLLGPGTETDPLDDRDIPAHVMEQMQRMQNRRGQQPRVGIFNQRPTTSAIWNQRDDDDAQSGLLAESTGGASEASSRSNMLAKMFQPPWDLMYRGGWETARGEGREQQKWMLVNIQDGSVFDCQVLNRDLWKNPGVAETIREHFIFLQYSKDDVRAEQYLQYYFHEYSNPDLYPHIAIVDPRTGEQVKVWSTKVPKPGEFLMQLHEFLDRYSLSSNARNPVARRKPEAKKSKNVDQMTEEEQLERAMQASLAGQQLQPADTADSLRVEDPDDLTRSIGDVGRTTGPHNTSAAHQRGKAVETDASPSSSTTQNGHQQLPSIPSPQRQEEQQSSSPFSLIPSNRPHIEPPTSGGNVADTTRIQFRHPGGRIIRRFSVRDPVQRIFEWLKAEPSTLRPEDGAGKHKHLKEGVEGEGEGEEEAEGGDAEFEFELVSMGKNLIEFQHLSIEEAGLKNGTVMVELVH